MAASTADSLLDLQIQKPRDVIWSCLCLGRLPLHLWRDGSGKSFMLQPRGCCNSHPAQQSWALGMELVKTNQKNSDSSASWSQPLGRLYDLSQRSVLVYCLHSAIKTPEDICRYYMGRRRYKKHKGCMFALHTCLLPLVEKVDGREKTTICLLLAIRVLNRVLLLWLARKIQNTVSHQGVWFCSSHPQAKKQRCRSLLWSAHSSRKKEACRAIQVMVLVWSLQLRFSTIRTALRTTEASAIMLNSLQKRIIKSPQYWHAPSSREH